jgi:hypothetical protein
MQIKISAATVVSEVKDEPTNKIEYITQYSSKPYFRNALLKLSQANPENRSIICDYILAEQTQMNIKESTSPRKSPRTRIRTSRYHSWMVMMEFMRRRYPMTLTYCNIKFLKNKKNNYGYPSIHPSINIQNGNFLTYCNDKLVTSEIQ